MRSRWSFIHRCGPNCSIFISYIHYSFHIFERWTFFFRKSFHKRSQLYILFYFQFISVFFEQIINTLIINFKKRSVNKKFSFFIFTNNLATMMKYSRYYSWKFIIIFNSDHCKSFSTSCLSICENSSIIAFKNFFNYWKGCFFINIFLRCWIWKNLIKSELSVFFRICSIKHL